MAKRILAEGAESIHPPPAKVMATANKHDTRLNYMTACPGRGSSSTVVRQSAAGQAQLFEFPHQNHPAQPRPWPAKITNLFRR